MSAETALACIAQLGQAQQDALDQGALAFADGGTAWLRVAGVRVELPVPFDGCAIVELRHGIQAATESSGDPLLVRAASRLEQQRFLSTLPRSLGRVVGHSVRSLPLVWRGQGAELLLLAPPLRLFEQVRCRCDGPRLLFEQLGRDQRRELANRLRCELDPGAERAAALAAAAGIDRSLAAAYALAIELLPSTARDRSLTGRLERALGQGGGQLLDWYRDRAQQLVVRWQAAGRTITSALDAGTLAVASAGICVSGHDRDFDLTTLAAAVARPAAGDRSGHGDEEYGY